MIPNDQFFTHETLSKREQKRLWLPVTYYYQLENIGQLLGLTVIQAAGKFGELTIPEYVCAQEDKKLMFNPNLGAWLEGDCNNVIG